MKPEFITSAVLDAVTPERLGRLDKVVGLHAELVGLDAAPGDLVSIGDEGIPAEVVGLSSGRVTVLPFGSLDGVRAGTLVAARSHGLRAPVGEALIGRVLDGLGNPIDGGPSLDHCEQVSLQSAPPSPMDRPLVSRPIQTGVRSIDGLLTVGQGQRVGIMAGSGVGKSSLLSMLLRGTDADVTVLALVGERGREVREFLERDLGPEGLAKSVVIVATSDQPALVRRNAAFLATRIAESFRDDGNDVMLLMDSLTRFALAQREIGLAAGEMPATRGYPPSVFGLLPQLLERAGTSASGSITGFYTVLVEGDDLNDPIGDASRSILDGHIALSRRLANAGHFPSIDILESASRVAPAVTTAEHQEHTARFRRLLAAQAEAQDLVELGLYAAGSDPVIDEAFRRKPAMTDFQQQHMSDLSTFDATIARLGGAVSGTDEDTQAEQTRLTQ